MKRRIGTDQPSLRSVGNPPVETRGFNIAQADARTCAVSGGWAKWRVVYWPLLLVLNVAEWITHPASTFAAFATGICCCVCSEIAINALNAHRDRLAAAVEDLAR